MSLSLGLSLTAFRPAFGTGAPDPGATGFVATVADFSRDRTLFDSGAANGGNAAAIPRSGSTDAPDGSGIEMRLVRADTGAEVAPWAVVATAEGGAWAGTHFGAQRSPHWLRPEVRVQGSSETATTANRFGVGHVWMIWQQSEHARMTQADNDNTTPEAVTDGEAVQIITANRSGGVDEDIAGTPSAVLVSDATVANGTATASYAALANVLAAERPGEKFAVVFLTKGGTSFVTVMGDGADNRDFDNDKAIHDFATADGQTVGLVWSSWYAQPKNLAANWGRVFLGFSHGKTYDGTDFVDGDNLVNGGAGNYSLSVGGANYDVDHTARELYGDTVPPWVLSGPHLFMDDGNQQNGVRDASGVGLTGLENIEACRIATRELIAAHPTLYRKGLELLPYRTGYDREVVDGASFKDWGDLPHPDDSNDDGLTRFARLTAHSLLHGAGLTDYEEPVFNRFYWEPAGAYVEAWFEDSAGATPDITTTRIERGEALQTDQSFDDPAQTMAHVTDVFGWEINKRPVERAEIVTGTSVTSKVVRVYPNSGTLDGASLVEFGRGGASGKIRDPEDFYGEHWKNLPLIDVPAAGIEGIPVSALPTIVSPLAAPATDVNLYATAPVELPSNGIYVTMMDDAYVSLGNPAAAAAKIYCSGQYRNNSGVSWNVASTFPNGTVGTLLFDARIFERSAGPVAEDLDTPISQAFDIIVKVASNSALSTGVNYSETISVPVGFAGVIPVRLDFVAGTTAHIGWQIIGSGSSSDARIVIMESIVLVTG